MLKFLAINVEHYNSHDNYYWFHFLFVIDILNVIILIIIIIVVVLLLPLPHSYMATASVGSYGILTDENIIGRGAGSDTADTIRCSKVRPHAVFLVVREGSW